jgi:hypothetical protein
MWNEAMIMLPLKSTDYNLKTIRLEGPHFRGKKRQFRL